MKLCMGKWIQTLDPDPGKWIQTQTLETMDPDPEKMDPDPRYTLVIYYSFKDEACYIFGI